MRRKMLISRELESEIKRINAESKRKYQRDIPCTETTETIARILKKIKI